MTRDRIGVTVLHIISALVGAGASIGLAERAVHDGDADLANHWLDEAQLALDEARARLKTMDTRGAVEQ